MRCSSCGQRGKKIFSLIRFISFIYIIMPRLPTIFLWLLSDMIWFTIWSSLSNMVWFTSPSSCRCISKYITMHYKSPEPSHKPTLTHHTYELHRWTLTLFLGEQLFFSCLALLLRWAMKFVNWVVNGLPLLGLETRACNPMYSAMNSMWLTMIYEKGIYRKWGFQCNKLGCTTLQL